jgi:hypothetical protein
MESTINQYIYKGGVYGNVEFPTEPQDFDVVDAFLRVGSDANTLNGDPLPLPGSVTVAIVDGSGTSQASQAAETRLQAVGFDVTGCRAHRRSDRRPRPWSNTPKTPRSRRRRRRRWPSRSRAR